MNPRYLLLYCTLFLLVSCEKKDKPITLPPKGDGQVIQVDMGETYEFQYFINLETQQIVHVSKIDAWDLGFQTGSNDWAVFLNGGKGMAAYNTHKTVFSDVSYLDTTQAKSSWSFDSPKGLADSSAIGNWKSEHPVYIVRLNETGTKLRKIQITNEDAFQYTILVGDINSSIPVSLTIIKNPDCNFTYFSFDLLATVNDIEPNKNAWDLQVTRYNYSFFDQTPVLRYVVNGFLLNPTKTSAYKDSLTSYNSIDTHFADSVTLSSYRDAIGFDWKSYNIDKGLYTIVAKYNYVIKNQNDHVFKLHFLDYYSSTGIKGSPKFEFYQLK